jgi:hypothetical protein
MLRMASSGPFMSPVTTRAWLDILRGAWMMLPGAPAPSEVVAMLREKEGQEEAELAWLEALAGCLGAAVALARGQNDLGSQVRKPRMRCRVPSVAIQSMEACTSAWGREGGLGLRG